MSRSLLSWIQVKLTNNFLLMNMLLLSIPTTVAVLPYGISSAPGIFQYVMENLLRGISAIIYSSVGTQSWIMCGMVGQEEVAYTFVPMILNCQCIKAAYCVGSPSGSPF